MEGYPECQFCRRKDAEFDREEIMDLHYWKDCAYLTNCKYCDSVIEIPQLRTHWLQECEKKGELRSCQRCK